MARALAAVHHQDRLRRETGPLAELQQAIAQRPFSERRELVEQGKDQHRRDHHHHELEARHHRPRPEPPERAHPSDQLQHEPQQGITDHHREQEALHPVEQPELRGRGVEAEPFLQTELAPPIEGQGRHRERRADGEQPGGIRPGGGADVGAGPAEAPRQRPPEQGDEQDDQAPAVLPSAETRSREGVGDRLRVGRGIHDVAERLGHGIGVRPDVPAVEPRQAGFGGPSQQKDRGGRDRDEFHGRHVSPGRVDDSKLPAQRRARSMIARLRTKFILSRQTA